MNYVCIEETVIPVKEHFAVCPMRKSGGQGGAGGRGCILCPKGMLSLPWMQKEELPDWNRKMTLEKICSSACVVCSFSLSILFVCRTAVSVLQLPSPFNDHCL